MLHLIGSGATAYISARNIRDSLTRPHTLAALQLAESGSVPYALLAMVGAFLQKGGKSPTLAQESTADAQAADPMELSSAETQPQLQAVPNS